MREAFNRLLRDLTLVTLALAIAVGWSLFQVAEGVGELVIGLSYEIPEGGRPTFGVAYYPGDMLAWDVGGRILTLGSLVEGLVELGFVLAVAAVVYRHPRRNNSEAF